MKLKKVREKESINYVNNIVEYIYFEANEDVSKGKLKYKIVGGKAKKVLKINSKTGKSYFPFSNAGIKSLKGLSITVASSISSCDTGSLLVVMIV